MPRYSRRRRFGTAARAAVTQTTIAARKRGKCRQCRGYYEKGETIAVLRLRKSLRTLPCGHTLPGTKRFHTGCVPTDWNVAMGYDPNAVPHNAPPPPSSNAHTAAPPPKPISVPDAQLAAIAAVQQLVKARARGNPVWKAQVDKTFSRFTKMSALSLRPGTDEEGIAALRGALIESIKLVF